MHLKHKLHILCVSVSPFNGHFPGEPGLASFVEAKDDGDGGDNSSYKTRKAPVKSSPSVLQARRPSCRPTHSVKALKGNI